MEAFRENRWSIEYPADENGGYTAIEYQSVGERTVSIVAAHQHYVMPGPIQFATTEFEKCQDIRMLRKSVVAEVKFAEAVDISVETVLNIERGFSVLIGAINLAPRGRYYLLAADMIGRRIECTAGDTAMLMSRMLTFVNYLEHDDAFSALSKETQYEIWLKLGSSFGNSTNLSKVTDGLTTCLDHSLRCYDHAIELAPNKAEAFQGKYLVERKAELHLAAIETIDHYFKLNAPVKSELTIKSFLVDWADLVRLHTGFRGGEADMAAHARDIEYLHLWQRLLHRLVEYENY